MDACCAGSERARATVGGECDCGGVDCCRGGGGRCMGGEKSLVSGATAVAVVEPERRGLGDEKMPHIGESPTAGEKPSSMLACCG